MKIILIRSLASILGTVGLAMLFRAERRQLPLAAVGGLFTYLVYALFEWLTGDLFLSNFAAALGAALLAYGFAVLSRTPAIVFHTTFLIPLVPGGLLYSTMYSLIGGDTGAFLSYGGDTVRIGLGIAAGILLGGAMLRARKMIQVRLHRKK